LEVSGVVRPIYGSLGVKRLSSNLNEIYVPFLTRCRKFRDTIYVGHDRFIPHTSLFIFDGYPFSERCLTYVVDTVS